MSQWFIENIFFGKKYDKHFVLKYSFNIEKISLNEEYYVIDDRLFLFINLKKENQLFQTHFLSRERLLWAESEKYAKEFNKLKDIFRDGLFKVLLFVNTSSSMKEYTFLGEIPANNIQPTFEVPNRSGIRKKGFIVNLLDSLPLPLWDELGWSIQEKVLINNHVLPIRLLEIIRDGYRLMFLRIKGEKLNNFPCYVYTIEHLTWYVNRLCIESVPKYDNLDLSQMLCIGEFKEDFILLDYRDDREWPSIWSFFGQKKVADNIGIFTEYPLLE